ncbi:MAG: MurR/RpiR family transcriptional regulator [bacterium]
MLDNLIRIRSHLPSLNRSQRAIAEYILRNPELVLSQSITQLAKSSRASSASISRFCRLLGYPKFPDMKAALRVDLLSPESGEYPQIDVADSVPQVVEKVFGIARQGLIETLTLLDRDEVERAAGAIAGARKVEFFGTGGSSGPLAQLAAYKFMNLGITAGAYVDPIIQRRAAEQLADRDVAFGISHSGIARPVVEALKIARGNKATTICLTNYAGSPIIEVSDIKLLTAIERGAPLFGEAIASRIPQLCVIDSLYSTISLIKYRESFQMGSKGEGD